MSSAHLEHIEIPPLRSLALGAGPRLIEGVLIPTLLFVALLRLGGQWTAIGGALAWSTAVIVTRLVLRRRVPTIVVLGLGALALRTTIAVAAQSSFVYFFQPTIVTAAVGVCFLGSAMLGRPLVLRMARDFCPIPDDVMAHGHLRRFFLGISVLWGVVQLLNASITLWLLLSQSLGTFVVLRTTMTHTLTVTAIAISVLWFRRITRPNPSPAFALTP
jgi:intracellular septation protein A